MQMFQCATLENACQDLKTINLYMHSLGIRFHQDQLPQSCKRKMADGPYSHEKLRSCREWGAI